MFEQKGVIVIDKATVKMSEDDMMLAIEICKDFSTDEECYEITTSPSEFSNVRRSFRECRNWNLLKQKTNGTIYNC